MSTASSDAAGPAQPKPAKAKLKVPWPAWLGVLFVIAIFYGSQLVSGALVSGYAIAKGLSESQMLSWLENSVTAQFVYVLVAEILAVGAVYLFLRIYKAGFASIGLRRPRWSDPLYGLAAAPAYFVLFFLIVLVVKHFVPGLDVNQEQQIGFGSVHGGLQLALTFVSLVILPPIAEEIMTRGFLYTTLKKVMPLIGAALLTSLAFAVAHLPAGGASGPLYIAAIDTFILSLILVYLREKTGGLWASITLHAIKNGVAFTLLFVLHV